MSRIVQIRHRAALVLDHHYRFVAYDSFNAAERLLTAFDDAVEKLADIPGWGRRENQKIRVLLTFVFGQ